MFMLINRIRYSLALRLLLLSLATLVAIILLFSFSIGFALRGQFNAGLLPHVLQYQQYIYQDIGSPPNLVKAQFLADKLSLDIYIQGPDVNWSSSDKLLVDKAIKYKKHTTPGIEHAHDHGKFYLKKEQEGFTTVIVVRRTERHISSEWKLAVIVGLFLVLVLCYLAIRRLFKPIDVIKYGVNKIGDGELSHRIIIAKKDELGELAGSINAMTDEIEAMLNAKRTLLLAISHELRSPITRCLVSLELLEDSKNKNSIKRDLREVEILLRDLLEGEKLSQKHIVLDLSKTDVKSLVDGLLQSSFTQTTIVVNVQQNLPEYNLDATRIRLLISNLLSNALRFNREEVGTVSLRIDQKEEGLVIEVEDYGYGVDEKHTQHMTDAFYRVDPSRQRKTGGYGLGLYLCNAIAIAHHGSLEISSVSNQGTVVRVVLPSLS